MKSDTRKELLEAVGELSKRYPHWRFGQLVSNIAGWADVNVWEIEDDQMLNAAKAHLEQLVEREKIEA